MSPDAKGILDDAIVIDSLRGAVLHRTPRMPASETLDEVAQFLRAENVKWKKTAEIAKAKLD